MTDVLPADEVKSTINICKNNTNIALFLAGYSYLQCSRVGGDGEVQAYSWFMRLAFVISCLSAFLSQLVSSYIYACPNNTSKLAFCRSAIAFVRFGFLFFLLAMIFYSAALSFFGSRFIFTSYMLKLPTSVLIASITLLIIVPIYFISNILIRQNNCYTQVKSMTKEHIQQELIAAGVDSDGKPLSWFMFGSISADSHVINRFCIQCENYALRAVYIACFIPGVIYFFPASNGTAAEIYITCIYIVIILSLIVAMTLSFFSRNIHDMVLDGGSRGTDGRIVEEQQALFIHKLALPIKLTIYGYFLTFFFLAICLAIMPWAIESIVIALDEDEFNFRNLSVTIALGTLSACIYGWVYCNQASIDTYAKELNMTIAKEYEEEGGTGAEQREEDEQQVDDNYYVKSTMQYLNNLGTQALLITGFAYSNIISVNGLSISSLIIIGFGLITTVYVSLITQFTIHFTNSRQQYFFLSRCFGGKASFIITGLFMSTLSVWLYTLTSSSGENKVIPTISFLISFGILKIFNLGISEHNHIDVDSFTAAKKMSMASISDTMNNFAYSMLFIGAFALNFLVNLAGVRHDDKESYINVNIISFCFSLLFIIMTGSTYYAFFAYLPRENKMYPGTSIKYTSDKQKNSIHFGASTIRITNCLFVLTILAFFLYVGVFLDIGSYKESIQPQSWQFLGSIKLIPLVIGVITIIVMLFTGIFAFSLMNPNTSDLSELSSTAIESADYTMTLEHMSLLSTSSAFLSFIILFAIYLSPANQSQNLAESEFFFVCNSTIFAISMFTLYWTTIYTFAISYLENIEQKYIFNKNFVESGLYKALYTMFSFCFLFWLVGTIFADRVQLSEKYRTQPINYGNSAILGFIGTSICVYLMLRVRKNWSQIDKSTANHVSVLAKQTSMANNNSNSSNRNKVKGQFSDENPIYGAKLSAGRCQSPAAAYPAPFQQNVEMPTYYPTAVLQPTVAVAVAIEPSPPPTYKSEFSESQSHSHASKNNKHSVSVLDFSVADVVNFIRNIQNGRFSQYAANFESNYISGKVINVANSMPNGVETMLTEIGITSSLARMQLRAELNSFLESTDKDSYGGGPGSSIPSYDESISKGEDGGGKNGDY